MPGMRCRTVMMVWVTVNKQTNKQTSVLTVANVRVRGLDTCDLCAARGSEPPDSKAVAGRCLQPRAWFSVVLTAITLGRPTAMRTRVCCAVQNTRSYTVAESAEGLYGLLTEFCSCIVTAQFPVCYQHLALCLWEGARTVCAGASARNKCNSLFSQKDLSGACCYSLKAPRWTFRLACRNCQVNEMRAWTRMVPTRLHVLPLVIAY